MNKYINSKYFMNISQHEITENVKFNIKTEKISIDKDDNTDKIIEENASCAEKPEKIKDQDPIHNSEPSTNIKINTNIIHQKISTKKKLIQKENKITFILLFVSICMFILFFYISIQIYFPKIIESILIMLLALFFFVFSVVIITDVIFDFHFEPYLMKIFLVVVVFTLLTCASKYFLKINSDF